MRIILVGQAAFAEQVLARLVERGDSVLAVYCPPDRSPGRPDPVKVRADQIGVPVRQHRSLKRPEVTDEFRGFDPDLTVLAYVTQIVPESVISIPRFGTICFHPSLLPRYRGGSAINWQLIKGETRTGVTVFHTDAGIDTGPILLQKEAEIPADATAGSLYYKTLFPLGVEAVVESVALIESGRAPRIAQDEGRASYDPLCRDEHAAVSWDRPAPEVYNLIRGCDPQPGAFTRAGECKIRLYDAALVCGGAIAPGWDAASPGTVVSVADESFSVAASGGALHIGRVRSEGPQGTIAAGKKMLAGEFARASGIGVGTRLA